MERLDPDTIRAAAEGARARGLDRDVGDLLAWAWSVLGDRLMMSTAFGKSGMVILHVLKERAPEIPVYFLDTGFHFQETLSYLKQLEDEWKIALKVHRPALYGVEFTRRHGEKLYERDPDFCCHKNKVEPMAELIGENGRYQGWITGVRRDQAATRANAETIELLEGNLVKIQPLAHWTRQDVDDYLEKHSVPLHPLFAKGYASIGCEPCTRPTGSSKDERAGRWAGKAKTECGLHTFWKQNERERAAAAQGGEPPSTISG